MHDLLPQLEHKGFMVQMGTLLLLILVSFVLFNILGLVLAIPFFGMDMLLNFDQAMEYKDAKSLAFMKYLQVLSQVGIFIMPPLAFAWLYNRKASRYLKLRVPFQVYPFFIAVLVLTVSIPFINYLVQWNEQMTFPEFLHPLESWMRNLENQAAQMTKAFLEVDTIGGLLINLVIVALLAAIGEELLFRGVVLKILLQSLRNIHLAVIISAILFSALHGQFYGFVPRAVLGILFGYIFVWTGNLWIPIILHMLFNGVSVVAAFLYTRGMITSNYEDLGEASETWIIALSFVFTLALLILLWKISQAKKAIAIDG